MSSSLDKNDTLLKLIKFALPSIIMMMFFSLYTIIDGLFVSNFVSTVALSAINIVFPVISLGLGISIMVASGGSAIIAKKMGEKKKEEAKEIFTFLVIVEILLALILSLFGNLFIDSFVRLLGATDAQFEMAKSYLRIYLIFVPFSFLQNAFQVFFVTAGKPKIGLSVITAAGCLNILLDYIFIVVMQIGIAGAALGTCISYLIPALGGLLYFSFQRKGMLYFKRFKMRWKIFGASCLNGSSEMMTNVATAVTTFLFNYQCLKYYGEAGVAAITIVLYFQFLFSAVFFGFSQGTAPIVSYYFGSKNQNQLKRVYRNSLWIVSCLSIAVLVISFASISPVATLFAGNGSLVYQIIMKDFGWFSCSLLLMGISIFASSYFTALGDGITSSTISFLRTLVFLVLSLLLIPLWMGKSGIWFSVTVAEILGSLVSIFYLVYQKRKFGY